MIIKNVFLNTQLWLTTWFFRYSGKNIPTMDHMCSMVSCKCKQFQKVAEVVQQLSKDEAWTFPKAGLGSKATEEIIRKYVQERRRKQKDSINGSDDQRDSSRTSASSPDAARAEKRHIYEW